MVTIELTQQELFILQDAIGSYRENLVDCIADGVEVDENRALLKTINKDIFPKFGMKSDDEEMESDDNEVIGGLI